MRKIIFLPVLLLFAGVAVAAPYPGHRPFAGDQLQVGLGLRMEGRSVFALEIPVMEFSLPFIPQRLFLDLGIQLQFGAEDFFIDGYSSVSLRAVPVPRVLHFYLRYGLSTGIAFWDHYGHILEAGGGLGVPLTDRAEFVLTGGYYLRAAERLLDYLYSDSYYRTVSGWTFRAGVRWTL